MWRLLQVTVIDISYWKPCVWLVENIWLVVCQSGSPMGGEAGASTRFSTRLQVSTMWRLLQVTVIDISYWNPCVWLVVCPSGILVGGEAGASTRINTRLLVSTMWRLLQATVIDISYWNPCVWLVENIWLVVCQSGSLVRGEAGASTRISPRLQVITMWRLLQFKLP